MKVALFGIFIALLATVYNVWISLLFCVFRLFPLNAIIAYAIRDYAHRDVVAYALFGLTFLSGIPAIIFVTISVVSDHSKQVHDFTAAKAWAIITKKKEG